MAIFDAIFGFLKANWAILVTIAAIIVGSELLLRFFTDRLGKRAHTIARLIRGVGHVVLVIALLIWLLRLIGIDPTPILASAGVVGLAIGFGAQTLVKDFVSGMFIIAENQYSVGDLVVIGGNEGRVKCLNIRSTVLIDKDNNTIFIPNGSVTTVINKTVHRIDCNV